MYVQEPVHKQQASESSSRNEQKFDICYTHLTEDNKTKFAYCVEPTVGQDGIQSRGLGDIRKKHLVLFCCR